MSHLDHVGIYMIDRSYGRKFAKGKPFEIKHLSLVGDSQLVSRSGEKKNP